MTSLRKAVVWERENKTGKWCPYSSEVCQLLEQSYQSNLNLVCLGNADPTLQSYSVHFQDFIQISNATGTVLRVRRQVCEKGCAFAQQVLWQWHVSSKDEWQAYDSHLLDFIESSYQTGKKTVDLSKEFPEYCYKINFHKMTQQNKQTKRHRSIRRVCTTPFPMVEANNICQPISNVDCNGERSTQWPQSHLSGATKHNKNSIVSQVGDMLNEIKKPSDSDSIDPLSRSQTGESSCELIPSAMAENTTMHQNSDHLYASVNGRAWKNLRPPHTPDSEIKPVPGISALPKFRKGSKRKQVPEESCSDAIDIVNDFTEVTVSPPDTEEQICIICYEPLKAGSSYDGDATVIKLKICQHLFHKSCIKAMYESGPKEKYLQCPTCKEIQGIKYGIQPPGKMVYHVIPYSLPGHYDCDTIRIIYDIPSGVQGQDHPFPGSRYTARGFPRHCYLPDNEMGRKILRLLVKAWERRLIFTIGSSSTTGEQNTVTWNEIHHKTEFGFNKHGHGYPDPNYFENVISELASHGVVESTYAWYPA